MKFYTMCITEVTGGKQFMQEREVSTRNACHIQCNIKAASGNVVKLHTITSHVGIVLYIFAMGGGDRNIFL